jgi:hypothetical protein
MLDISEKEIIVGASIIKNNGRNWVTNAAHTMRYDYINFNKPLLIECNLDTSIYAYSIWTYETHSHTTGVGNPTKGEWSSQKRVVITPPEGKSPCFRIGVIRLDQQPITTDLEDPTSDVYIIKHGFKCYWLTDSTLNEKNVGADAYTTGQKINSLIKNDFIDDKMSKGTETYPVW